VLGWLILSLRQTGLVGSFLPTVGFRCGLLAAAALCNCCPANLCYVMWRALLHVLLFPIYLFSSSVKW